MINILDASFLAPSGALVIAIIASILIIRRFQSQTWAVKKWLVICIFSWIPWSGMTVMMRLTDNQESALMFLRISFTSLQLAFFGMYRFHFILTFKSTDRRYSSYGMAILVAFNILSGWNERLLGVVRTENGLYFTDSFHSLLIVTNLLAAAWTGYQTLGALRDLHLFSNFFSPNRERNPLQIFAAILIFFVMFIVLIVWVMGDTSGAKPDTTIFIFFAWSVISFMAYTYGIRPLSRILSPQRIWAFIVINSRSGLPIYSKSFNSEIEDDGGGFLMFSGALNATNTIIKHHLNSPSSINLVTLDDKAVLVHQEKDVLFCLMIDHASAQFEIILDVLVNRITNHLEFQTLDTFSPLIDTKFIDPILNGLLEA